MQSLLLRQPSFGFAAGDVDMSDAYKPPAVELAPNLIQAAPRPKILCKRPRDEGGEQARQSDSEDSFVRERLRPYLESKLKHLPQFAYTNGRGVLDALLRVHSHLRKARLLSLQGRASRNELHQGRRANPCVGGLSFSLDLEGAFDSVPRPKLAESLRRLDAPEDLIHLAMEFYSDARYHTHIGEHKGHVTTTCGIKQGCTDALLPLICSLRIHLPYLKTYKSEWGGTGYKHA